MIRTVFAALILLVLLSPACARRRGTWDDVACVARSGKWMCGDRPRPADSDAVDASGPHPMAVGPGMPYPSPNWKVPKWVVDVNNASGCSSNTNTGTSTTCGSGGVGPLATAAALVERWGCENFLNACVVLTTAVIVDFMSGTSTGSDPFGFDGVVVADQGGSLTITAENNAIATGTTTACVHQSVSANTIGSFTSVALASAAAGSSLTYVTASGQTNHQWCEYKPSGTTCSVTTEMGVAAPPLTSFAPPIGTCTTGGGDAVTAYAPYAVNLVSVRPTVTGYAFADAGVPVAPVVVSNLTVYDPNGVAAGDPIRWGSNVSAVDVAFQRTVQIEDSGGDSINSGFVNPLFLGGVTGGRLSSGKYVFMMGGSFYPSPGSQYNFTGQGIVLDGFSWVASNLTFPQGVQIASMIAAQPNFSSAVTVDLGSTSYFALANGGYTTLEVWGINASIINVRGNTRYDPLGGALSTGWTGINAGTYTSSQLTLNINKIGTGCSLALAQPSPSPANQTLYYCGISLTNANVDASAGSTGFGGHAYSSAAGNGGEFQGGLQ